ncbi:MAG: hypothetical protein Q4F00_07145 [bacterium]|nr:hypothetical protein [bacterium]
MANEIQAVRNVYDIMKASKDNGSPLTDDCIQMLLKHTVTDPCLINKYKRFESGFAAEDLFMQIYSLLPWVRLITPLGQEQFPETSKEEYQVVDYEVIYEIGDYKHTKCILVEAKLIDGDKKTHKIKKCQYDVLRNYAENKHEDVLYALFWRKYGLWTLVPIEAYSEKSSTYKISFEEAFRNDVSSIFGDYTYFFMDTVFRKSRYTSEKDSQTEYMHMHEQYGSVLYDGISSNGKDYEKLCFLEIPVLDCAFDFKENHIATDGNVTELIETMEKMPYVYRLSNLILKYLLKTYCYNPLDMYCSDNDVVKNAFNIVDTVRRKCNGKKYYLIPKNNSTTDRLFQTQFGNVRHIIDAYKRTKKELKGVSFVSHDGFEDIIIL